MLARETEHKRCEICFPRRALARAEGRRRGRSPLFAAGSMPGSSMGIVESYSGACGGARSCLAIGQARMWLLGKSCVSCLGRGKRRGFLAWKLIGNIVQSFEAAQRGARGGSLGFLASFCESAEHLCRAPRSPANRRSVRERLAPARTRAEETEGEPQRAGLYCCLAGAAKKREKASIVASLTPALSYWSSRVSRASAA